LKPIGTHNYFVYILTNNDKSVLYTGVTNDLERRLFEHKEDSIGGKKSYAGKYNCVNLIYYEHFDNIEYAIKREKKIKGWSRHKKKELISNFNSEWRFLNNELP